MSSARKGRPFFNVGVVREMVSTYVEYGGPTAGWGRQVI